VLSTLLTTVVTGRLAAVGLTGTHAMDGTLASLERLRALESPGDLVTRILLPFTIEPDTPEEMWEAYAAAGAYDDQALDGQPRSRATRSVRRSPAATATGWVA
jgi:hypothetical protein